MNRIWLLAIAAALASALVTVAQQAPLNPGAPGTGGPGGAGVGVPAAQDQLKLLTEKLELTADQQAKIKPILQELNDAIQAFTRDASKSHEELLGNVRASRQQADRKIRDILNDDQKKKLDQLYQQPHPELHGNLSGATPRPPQDRR